MYRYYVYMYKATPIAPMGPIEGVHMPQYMCIYAWSFQQCEF